MVDEGLLCDKHSIMNDRGVTKVRSIRDAPGWKTLRLFELTELFHFRQLAHRHRVSDLLPLY